MPDRPVKVWCPATPGVRCVRGADCLENMACIDQIGDRRPGHVYNDSGYTKAELLTMAVAYRAMAPVFDKGTDDSGRIYCERRAEECERLYEAPE